MTPLRFTTRSLSLAITVLALGLLSPSPAPLRSAPLQLQPSRLYVDFSAKPAPAHLLAYDLCFIDAEAEAELGPGRALGHAYFARLGAISLAPGSAAGQAAKQAGLVMSGAGAGWDDLLVDVLHPQWISWVLKHQAQAAANRGFSGFLLDGASTLAQLDRLRPESALQHRKAFVSLVFALRREFPDKPFVLRGGFDFLPFLSGKLEGVLAENLLAAPDAECTIRRAQSRGLKIFAVEFGRLGDVAGHRAAADRLLKIGCLPFITTPDLDGLALGPLQAQPRHVVVLHGWDSGKQSRPLQSAAETWTARTLAPALNWLDLAPRYIAVPDWLSSPEAAARLFHPRPAAIIIDPELALPPASQAAAAEWLVQARQNQIPILLAGQPFTEPSAWSALASTLGLTGTGQPTPAACRSSLSRFEASWFNSGRVPPTHALRCFDLQSPETATRVLNYRMSHPADAAARSFDACFLADWGGAWFDSALRAPIDTFRFLEAALRRDSAGPVPDTTTLAGRQVYLSTVQGRGFCETSWKSGDTFCGEVLHNELRRFPSLPATVAVSESDIRGWSATSNPAEAMRYEAVARAIFSLAHIEPAANSYSRPASWSADSFQAGPLRPVIPDQRSGIEREITGSLYYVKRRLVPPGKSLQFFLWPEGAEPSQAALDHLAKTGASHFPGSWRAGWNVSPVADLPELAPEPPILQPGTARAIASAWFQIHARPDSRRLAPVHLAYSFSDLKKTATVEALREIWSWCASQPLLPMTASTYAAFTRDAADIEIYPGKENHWRVVSSGRPATLRLPASRGVPDLARCLGVQGFTTHGDQLYLHIGGLNVCEIILRPADSQPQDPPAAHLHLVDADRLLDFYELHSDSARFRPHGRDAAVVTLGGLRPGSWYQLTASGSQTRLQASVEGRLTVKAPALATTTIQPAAELGKPYASR